MGHIIKRCDLMPGKPREKCGVFGIYGNDNAAEITLLGLKALQHRGQDSAGIAGYKGSTPNRVAGLGRVADVFPEGDLRGLKLEKAIGQVRYTTSKGLSVDHAQPVEVDLGQGKKFYLAHNGNIPDTRPLARLLDLLRIPYSHLNDTGMFAQAIGAYLKKGAGLVEAFSEVSPYVSGVYTVVMLTPKEMGAARCEYGIKPGSIGIKGDNIVVSSETCGLDAVGADFVRDINPGELIIIDDNGIASHKITNSKYKLCIFEPIYFADPKSLIYGKLVEDYRVDFGRALAREHRIDADIVVPLLNSGLFASQGFSEVSGIPIELALQKNALIDRTFITAGMEDRMTKAKSKYIPVKKLLQGKTVVTVDDSQVHGTTDLVTVPMLQEAGAKRVIVLKASPVYKYPNFYGTNTSDQSTLAASGRSVEQIRDWIKADYMGFLSLEGMKNVLGEDKDSFDYSVFDGNYPVPIGENVNDIQGLFATV